uniref:Dirigent protein n=1 Tax=Strongyloides papillosus TaxID=174720 RepID=A0A0N5B1W2_STREA
MTILKKHLIIFIVIYSLPSVILSLDSVDSVRVARISVFYPDADTSAIPSGEKWQTTMRKSILASLKFINKHWKICGNAAEGKNTPNDCGKLQVTGELYGEKGYRINATFTGQKDPIKNVKVAATSTLKGVVQIGLKGGIFQYTNNLKILGRPSMDLQIEEDYFCYPGTRKINQHQCIISDPLKASTFVDV